MMSFNPIVSIIVPVYNVESFLPRCIESILKQKYKNLEIILVDDGSTDRSGKICDGYSSFDERIKVIHKKNGGLSDARNTGLRASLGEYIFFVDSDDYISEETISSMLFAIDKENVPLVICDYKKVNEYDVVLDDRHFCLKNETLNNDDLFNNLTRTDTLAFVVAWSKLYKRELLDDIKFPVGKLHEDEFIAHKIFEKCDKAVTVSSPLYYYVQRKSSIMKKEISSKRLDGVDALINRCMFFYERKKYKYLDSTLIKCCKLYYGNLRPKIVASDTVAVANYDKVMKDFLKKYKPFLSFRAKSYCQFPRTICLLEKIKSKICGFFR